MENKIVNAILDSGAGCSIIDIGSLEEIGLADNIKCSHSCLISASGEKMDISGVVNITVRIKGIMPVVQEFTVLATKSYNNILLGRDFMKLFGAVKFDFDTNRVKLGRSWINGISINKGEKVRLAAKAVIPARSEQVVNVRCNNQFSLMNADIEPVNFKGNRGIFVSRARVLPNIHGIFQITVLNVTESDVVISNRIPPAREST